jgi:hypothetical protein
LTGEELVLLQQRKYCRQKAVMNLGGAKGAPRQDPLLSLSDILPLVTALSQLAW